MADTKAIEKVLKLVGAGVTVVAAAASLPGVKDGIDTTIKSHGRKAEEKQAMVEIPEVYSPDFRLTLEEATRWLEEDGLRARAVVAQPDIAFREYADRMVVRTYPRPKQKVKPGTRVVVKYVTAEVIKASQGLYEEREREKAEARQDKINSREEKARKRAGQRAEARQKLDNTVAGVKRGINDSAAKMQKSIGGLSPKKRAKPADAAQDAAGAQKQPE